MSSSRSTTSRPGSALVRADRQAGLVHAHDDPRDAGRVRSGDCLLQPVLVGGAVVVGPGAAAEVEGRRDHDDPHQRVRRGLVDEPLPAVGAHEPRQPVGQAAREPVDVTVGAARLVVAGDQLERVGGPDPSAHEAAPRLLLSGVPVGEVSDGEGEVVVAVGDRAQHGVGGGGRADVAEHREAHRAGVGTRGWARRGGGAHRRCTGRGRRRRARGGRRRGRRGGAVPGIRAAAGTGADRRHHGEEHECGRAPTGHARSMTAGARVRPVRRG